jgi:hypothetical protein
MAFELFLYCCTLVSARVTQAEVRVLVNSKEAPEANIATCCV